MKMIDKDLLSIQEARILAENASMAQKEMATYSQERLDDAIAVLVRAVLPHLEALAQAAADESDRGCAEDKAQKYRFLCDTLPRRLKDLRCVGVVSEDHEACAFVVGVPRGVVVSTPSAENAVASALHNVLVSLKAGNAVVVVPPPRCTETVCRLMDTLCEAAESAGLPVGSVSVLHTAARAGALALIEHPCTAVVINTGLPYLIEAAENSGKNFIYGGFGNNPAFVEASADVEQAAADIITSKAFDCGMVPGSEQSIVVDASVDQEMRRALEASGGYFMTAEEAHCLVQHIFCENGEFREEAIGKDAKTLARRAGFTVPENTRVLLADERYVSQKSPYAREKIAPVLAYYIEADWQHACEKCIELLIKDGEGHSLVIHSRDESVIQQFALKKPVGRMVINTPAAFGATGMTTQLFPSFTLGSGSAGLGITADNLSPVNLIYCRQVAYGLRSCAENHVPLRPQPAAVEDANDMDVLYDFFKQALLNPSGKNM